MSDPTPSIWKRPLRGLPGILISIGLLAAAIFVVFLCLGLVLESHSSPADILPTLLISIALAGVAIGALLFARWLCCWRNLRRFLFAIACLLTLLALAFAEENWRGKHDWETSRRRWEAQGEKFSIAALVPPPVPDEKNFAMTPLLKPILDYTQTPRGNVVWGDTNGQARVRGLSAFLSPQRQTNDQLVLGSFEKGTFADLAACAAYYRGNTNYPQAPPTAGPAETILFALDKFRPELTELREAAAARPYCRFPVHYDYEPCWAILLPHLSTIKGLTQLVHVRAVAELEASHPADAFEDLQLGLRFSESIHDEPLLISHLVRIAALAIDLQTISEGLLRHVWTEPELAILQTNLAGLNLLAEHKLTMYGEQAFEAEGLDYLRRQRWRSNPFDYMGTDGGARSTTSLSFFPSGWYYQNMLTISRLLHEYSFRAVDEQARRIFPEITERGSHTLELMRIGPYTVFAKLLLPALAKPVERSGRSQTYVDTARVACALERYRLANGTLPETLEALAPRFIDQIPHDVIDGKPLRYRRNSDSGYLLYSIGWNQKDDGGQLAWVKAKKESQVDFHNGDWVWSMPK